MVVCPLECREGQAPPLRSLFSLGLAVDAPVRLRLTIRELEDLRQQKENAAKIALNDLEFGVANVLNDEARKLQEEIKRRKQHGESTV